VSVLETQVSICHDNIHRYLHLGCLASESLVDRTRVSLAWTIMRLRHPLLASKVIMNDYHDIRFTCVKSSLPVSMVRCDRRRCSYDAPLSPNEAVSLADQSLEYRKQTKDGQPYLISPS